VGPALQRRAPAPHDATVQKVYDNLDFQRGVQAFLVTMPAASAAALRKGIRSFGPDNQTVLIAESLFDSRSLFLTPNTESVYAQAWIDLKYGPIVIESPPNTLGILDDFWFHYATDLGNAGPDKGKGGKFLILPPEASRYDFYADLRASMTRRGVATAFPPAFLRRWEKLLSITPQELGIDPCPIRLAGAVAGSASFPPLVGPITFRVGEQEVYWHTGDGGLYENQGIESLLFVFLKQLQERAARRALILAFDSSFPFDVGERRLSRRSQPFSLWNYDYTRIPSIMEQRASTYQALFLRSLQLEGVFPDDQTIRVVQLRHTDAQ
jgi:hypothetical protein